MKKVLSILILIIFPSLILGSFYAMAKIAVGSDSDIYQWAEWATECREFEENTQKNKVILRLDDVQAFSWRDVQLKMIKEAFDREAMMVVGVIPYLIEKDKRIYYFLKQNNCRLEIAQHGWDHNIESGGGIPEFGDLGDTEAYDLILKGKPELEEIAEKEISSFIPPNNQYSRGTAVALDLAGFEVVSSEGQGYYDYTVPTYSEPMKGLVPVETIINNCERDFAERSLCIIMLHPQDYATDGVLDKKKFKHYIHLLDRLEGMNVEFTTFERVFIPETDASVEVAKIADKDRDGLSDLDEAIYNTDPFNRDTDGDGFLDGEEIINGFNPKGEGKLN